VSLWIWLAVAAVGGTGSVCRFAVGEGVALRFGRRFPFGTLAINLSGAFILGLLDGLALKGTAMLIAGTAAVGAFTTFSTWMLETYWLAEDAQPWLAVLNVVASVALGLGAALLGRVLGLHI
jgi:fluoride exporter